MTKDSNDQKSENQKIVILGASRGLGREIAKLLPEHIENCDLLLVSRKAAKLQELATQIRGKVRAVSTEVFDFSKPEEQQELLARLILFSPHRIFYLAGGGPHGSFAVKKWASHQWSLEINFLFPARLLHQFLQWSQSSQLVLVGSDIAENSLDSNAISYDVGKKALKNLVAGVIAGEPDKDIRLFSPGYMDTELLPRGAWPRKTGEILDPVEVAASFLEWVSLPKSEWHRSLPSPSR